MKIKIIYTQDHAQGIMDKDARLLEELANDPIPILHLYEWKNPSITYGHFIKIEKMLQTDTVKKLNIDLGKRPTGGGVIFHLYDFAFSFLLPSKSSYFFQNPMDNYKFVHALVAKALEGILPDHGGYLLPEDPKDSTMAAHFCMAKPTIYDLMIQGKKMVGAAQRKKKQGYLHQGSISIQRPEADLLKKLLLHSEEVEKKMQESGFYLLQENAQLNELYQMRQRVQDRLIFAFQEFFSKE